MTIEPSDELLTDWRIVADAEQALITAAAPKLNAAIGQLIVALADEHPSDEHQITNHDA